MSRGGAVSLTSNKLNAARTSRSTGRTSFSRSASTRAPSCRHYCWHPGLHPAGNCRMCLVKVSNSKKLEVSCMYPVADKMEVTTEGPEVDAGRKAVLEYMLINHPLDCPICDKAGECDLQDYTYKYRQGLSRFEEDKQHQAHEGPRAEHPHLGQPVHRLHPLRPVLRGGHRHRRALRHRARRPQRGRRLPGHPDRQPAVAQRRRPLPGRRAHRQELHVPGARLVHEAHRNRSAPRAAAGCNVDVTVLDNDIKRLQPRPNVDVNQYWMCDEGRLNTALRRAATAAS